MAVTTGTKLWVIIAGWFYEQGTWTPQEAWTLSDLPEQPTARSWSLACEGYLDPEWATIAAASEELRWRLGWGIRLEPLPGGRLAIHQD